MPWFTTQTVDRNISRSRIPSALSKLTLIRRLEESAIPMTMLSLNASLSCSAGLRTCSGGSAILLAFKRHRRGHPRSRQIHVIIIRVSRSRYHFLQFLIARDERNSGAACRPGNTMAETNNTTRRRKKAERGNRVDIPTGSRRPSGCCRNGRSNFD